MRRRPVLIALGALAAAPASAIIDPARVLAFPRDFGSHPDSRTEWWYATGWLAPRGAAEPTHGFQVTFFRSRTGVAADQPSRFAARQLVFAHAALTDLAAQKLRHDQRIAREGFGIATASETDTDVVLRGWTLHRTGPPDASAYDTTLTSEAAGFGLTLRLTASQPLLLQGTAGFSRKGPQPAQASHYYSQPQLVVEGRLGVDGRTQDVQGRAWFDHEWSDAYLAAEAVGWDWIGMNLLDGSALTAFRLKRADGSALWAGGSFRAPGGAVRSFADDEVRFVPGRRWTSPASRTGYPVEWGVETPAGRFRVRALVDAQELDSRASTGSIYWEGLSELLDTAGHRVGLGYLEMTGNSAALRF